LPCDRDEHLPEFNHVATLDALVFTSPNPTHPQPTFGQLLTETTESHINTVLSFNEPTEPTSIMASEKVPHDSDIEGLGWKDVPSTTKTSNDDETPCIKNAWGGP